MAEQKERKINELYKDSQKRLIGTLLASSDDSTRVFELVTVEDFAEPRYQVIFEAVVGVNRRNETVSAPTVAKELESTGHLAEAGGIKELYSLRALGYQWRSEAAAEVYAALVKEHAAKERVTTEIEERLPTLEPDSGVPAADSIAEIQKTLNDALYELSDESTMVDIHEGADAYEAILEERRRIAEENAGKADGLQGIPCLLPSINKYTTGWLPGQLITIGARTGVGKSIFAVNAVVAAAQADKSVLFFSLEMGKEEIQDRIVSSMTGVLQKSLKSGSLTEEERKILDESREERNKLKVTIDTDPKVTVDTIRARALRKAQSPEGLDFIIVDYLQLITPVGRFSSRQEAIADISRNMKLLAKQLQVPVMVLVQVNREDKNDESSIPQLHQIRESGAIAQDSDIVILIHRDMTTDDTIPHTLIILAKNRNGEPNKLVRCHSNLECSLFREIQKAADVNDEDDELGILSSSEEFELADDFDFKGADDFSDDDLVLDFN